MSGPALRTGAPDAAATAQPAPAPASGTPTPEICSPRVREIERGRGKKKIWMTGGRDQMATIIHYGKPVICRVIAALGKA